MYKLKILIAAEILLPTVGGSASWLAQVGPGLKKLGHEIKIISFASGGNFNDSGLDISYIELKQNKWLRWYKYIKLLKKEAKNYDVILALGNVLAGVAAIKAKKKYNIPVVLRVPGDFAWEKAQAKSLEPIWLEDFYKRKFGFYIEFFKKQQLKVARKVNKVITNSFYQADFIKKYWQVPAEKVVVIRNYFVGGKNFKLENNSVKKTLLVCGRLIKLKGNRQLLEFISGWLKKNPSWQLVIVGDGPDRENLENIAAKENLTDQVKFLGRVEHAKLNKYYQAADAYILYSLHEGSPNTVLEAINFNLPIIASSRGGTVELLEKYPKGELVEWGNKDNLLEALDKLKNGALDKIWNVTDREVFFTEFDSKKILHQWQEVLKKVVDN